MADTSLLVQLIAAAHELIVAEDVAKSVIKNPKAVFISGIP
jgi:hypothetical protein